MKRKILSALLALALCVGLAAPVLAAEPKTVTIDTIELTNVISEDTYEWNDMSFQRYYVEAPATITLLVDLGPGDLGSGVQKGLVNEDGSLYFYNDDNDYIDLATGNKGIVNGEFHADKGSTYALTEPGAYWVGCVEFSRSIVIIVQEGAPEEPVAPPAPEQPSDWAVETVNGAIEAGLVPEALQANYTQATTRAEFCALAVALYDAAGGEEFTLPESPFSDTTDRNVVIMARLEVVNGVGDGQFDPNGKLTREQAATMLARLAEAVGQPLPKANATFGDIGGISDWALDAVGQMQAAGIMSGVEENVFSPDTDYTREQSIATIWRLFHEVK